MIVGHNHGMIMGLYWIMWDKGTVGFLMESRF